MGSQTKRVGAMMLSVLAFVIIFIALWGIGYEE